MRPTILFCLLWGNVFSQCISSSSYQLNFGVVLENSPDSLPIILTNNCSNAVTISNLRFYSYYGANPFGCSDSNFVIAPSSSKTIFIRFAPLQNLFHNSELIILNNSHEGSVRIDLRGQGRYSQSYYSSTENLEEENLKGALNTRLAQGYTSLGYNTARDKIFMIIDNKKVNGQGATVNTLECVYTGREAIGYTSRSDAQTNFDFNTEHTFPQSFFGSSEPMKSDMFHLYPTDNTANNVRSNYPFGVVTTPTWAVGGSQFGNGVFEPRDVHKGNVARSMFYFVIKYQNYSNFLNSQESTLRQWFHQFPPDSIARKRNEDIFLLQHDRNPFIDYPQFLERIHSVSAFSIAPIIYSIDATEQAINFDSVSAGNIYNYAYAIVNNGNQILNLTNFNLSSISLSFTSGASDTTLNPGEALLIKIQLTPINNGPLNEDLTFNTNIPSQSFISIPVIANRSVTQLQPEFAPIGAYWYFTKNCFGPCIHYNKFTSTDTATIQGLLFKKITVSTDDSIQTINFPYHTFYLYGDSAHMYYAITLTDSLHLLADFNLNIGDTLTVDDITMPLVKAKSIVIGKGDTIINGYTLQYIDLINTSSNFELYNGKLIQNIGAESFLFPYSYLPDPPMGGEFRCYHDNIIGDYKNPVYSDSCTLHYDGFADILDENIFSINGNPVTGHLIIKNIHGNIRIINMLGQVIYKADSENDVDINVKSWSKGLYLILAEGDGRRVMKKILVE